MTQVISGLTVNLGRVVQEVTPGEETDQPGPWDLWVAGWNLLAQGRPLDVLSEFERVLPRGWLDVRSPRLVDAELSYLLASVMAIHNVKTQAADLAGIAQEILRRFLAGCQQDPSRAGEQALEALGAFFGPHLAVQWSAAGVPMQDLPPAWAMTRGIDMINGIARIRREVVGADAVIDDLLGTTAFAAQCTGARLDEQRIAVTEMTLADCCKEQNPQWARLCYASVLRRIDSTDILALQARANLALLTPDVAPDVWRDLARRAAEDFGDIAAAAQLEILACEADWRAGEDVHDAAREAILTQERVMPPGASFRSMFAAKERIETGYRLLATIDAHDADHSEQRLDEILSVLRAMLTGNLTADLEDPPSDDSWQETLARQRRPSRTVRALLYAFPGVGVLHLVRGIDCLIWVVYGCVRERGFVADWGIASQDTARLAAELSTAARAQLDADRLGDAPAVAALDEQIMQLGKRIGASLPSQLLDVLDRLDHLLYAPHPGGGLDEFPLTALHVWGSWLSERLTITRFTTFLSLQVLLSPNFRPSLPNRMATVVLGNSEWREERLRGLRRHATVVERMLDREGFAASIADAANVADLNRLLDGACGLLHYAGHGEANEVLEALPLPGGESYNPLSIEDYRGYRFPFVFLCACVAARIRYGEGGHFTGLLTGLIDRGSPAGIAFMTPIGERRGYLLAEEFYRQATQMPFGQAVSATLAAARLQEIPAYAWTALTAYGDPLFELTSMTGHGPLPGLRRRAVTWHSAVRQHCVWRTVTTAAAVHTRLDDVPAELRAALGHWLDQAFTPDFPVRALDALEDLAASAGQLSDVERLTVKAAVCAARSHTPQPQDALADASFLAQAGASLCDLPLNGLGLGLLGLARAKDGLAGQAREPLWEAVDKLWPYTGESPFIARLVGRCRQTHGTIPGTRLAR
ncbi:CHAT domain-containing protein [Streptomyces sp. NBC_00658]|uniref:CHAT domain-containing protein n=1 Tax=Streptomyces sp. NBC_00658 TaxID=2975800 RepID=UPI0032465353